MDLVQQFIDDPKFSCFSSLTDAANNGKLETLYKADLMQKGGSIVGYKISGEYETHFENTLNEIFKTQDFYAYLINAGTEDLETILVVSEAEKDGRRSSTMRRNLQNLPSMAAAKVEFLQEEVLTLDNRFRVSFFIGSKIYDRLFVVKGGQVKEGALRRLKLLDKKGILIK